jgi:hypothetical protein
MDCERLYKLKKNPRGVVEEAKAYPEENEVNGHDCQRQSPRDKGDHRTDHRTNDTGPCGDEERNEGNTRSNGMQDERLGQEIDKINIVGRAVDIYYGLARRRVG